MDLLDRTGLRFPCQGSTQPSPVFRIGIFAEGPPSPVRKAAGTRHYANYYEEFQVICDAEMKVELHDLITQTEAAEIRGVSVQSISYLVKRGKLKTVSIGKRKFLLRSEVEKFKPGLAGRPKGKAKTARKARPRKSN